MKYDDQGRAVLERHFSDHGHPNQHSNPHDHEYNWDNDYPQRGGVINYFDGNVPDLNKQYGGIFMSADDKKYDDDILVFPYRPEENKFETLGEFKIYIDAGWELEIYYHGVYYGIEKMMETNKFDIWDSEKRKIIATNLTLDQLLNYPLDGVKIKDFIATDDVEISDRPGPI